MMRGGEIFVPKLPSANIMDLVKAIAPACQVNIVGIRPGEKVHEVLIPADEAHHTVELDELFVIKPHGPAWTGFDWVQGRSLPADFIYASNTGPMLSVAQIQHLLGGLGYDVVDSVRPPTDQ